MANANICQTTKKYMTAMAISLKKEMVTIIPKSKNTHRRYQLLLQAAVDRRRTTTTTTTTLLKNANCFWIHCCFSPASVFASHRRCSAHTACLCTTSSSAIFHRFHCPFITYSPPSIHISLSKNSFHKYYYYYYYYYLEFKTHDKKQTNTKI